eukprot:gene10518-11622_t
MSLSSETEAELSDSEEEGDDIDNDVDVEHKDSPVHNRPKLPIKSKKNKRKRVKSNYEIFGIIGNSNLEKNFKSSTEVRDLISKTFSGMLVPEDNKKESRYVDNDMIKTLLEKGAGHVLRDDLRMLIVNYTNGGKKINNFWGKSNALLNMPEWWPSDIPFSSPNIRERDSTEDKPSLNRHQVVALGEAMREHLIHKSQLAQNSICDDIEMKDNEQPAEPHSDKNLTKTITDEEACHVASRLSFQDPENEPSQASNQSESAVTFKDINRKAKHCKMPSPVSISSDIHAAKPVTPVGRVDHINIAEKRQMMSPNFLPHEQTRQLALQSVAHLSEICDSDWNSFLQKVKQLDQSFMEQCRLFLSGDEEEFTMRTLPREVAVIDKMRRGRSGIPDGMVPVTATGNGDCLFNSVGKLLFGTEIVSPILRLVTAVDTIQHVKHYLSEFRDHYITTDDAYQMVYSLSTLAVHSRRPTGKKTTASDILHFAIRSEIMEIAKSHSFCGECNFPSDKYSVYFHWQFKFPESLCATNMENWTTICSERATAYQTKQNVRRIKRLGCHAVGDEREEWVNCANCSLHYHAACSGILEKRGKFICCLNEKARGDIMRDINSIKDFFPETTSILQWPQIVLKPKSSEVTVILTFFDLFCIHSYGLSTSAVEFYIKLLQNNIVTDCGIFVSNVFQANKILTGKEAMKNPRCVFPRDRLLDSSIVIFPCAQRMCVLDSMNAQRATNRRYLNTFKEYLQHLQRHEGNEVTDFFELDSKEYNDEQNTTIEIKDSFNFAERTRRKIRRQIYNLSKTS